MYNLTKDYIMICFANLWTQDLQRQKDLVLTKLVGEISSAVKQAENEMAETAK